MIAGSNESTGLGFSPDIFNIDDLDKRQRDALDFDGTSGDKITQFKLTSGGGDFYVNTTAAKI